VPDGQFEFLKVPFGLSFPSSLSKTHQSCVQTANHGWNSTSLSRLNNPCKKRKENLEKLSRVLTTAMEYGLEIFWKKCKLLVRQVEYLDFVIAAGQVQSSDGKI